MVGGVSPLVHTFMRLQKERKCRIYAGFRSFVFWTKCCFRAFKSSKIALEQKNWGQIGVKIMALKEGLFNS